MLFESMALTWVFYLSLAGFCLGTALKVLSWCFVKIGFNAADFGFGQRLGGAVRGVFSAVFSGKILVLIKVFILDVVLQVRTAQQDKYRWIMHLLIYWGFVLLLFMHALGALITAPLFGDDYSNLNPFFFLRDFFGFMVLAGVVMAALRRLFAKKPRPRTHAMDIYAMALVLGIICTGFLLEGAKIASHSEFMAMVEDYGGLDPDSDEEEITALESLWVKDYGLVSPTIKGPFDEETLEAGQEANEAYCASCHVSTKWAPGGFVTAKALSVAEPALDEAGAVPVLFWAHLLLCFLGLLYLPFSKMFHIIATPVSLLANAVRDETKSIPANGATFQAMELDACVHCGTCSRNCSALMAETALGNPLILPSEKMVFLKKLACGQELSKSQLASISQGVHLCTNCDRCTVSCPSGINLKSLWMNVREDLAQRDSPQPLVLSPLSFLRAMNKKDIPKACYEKPQKAAYSALAGDFLQKMAPDRTINLGGNGQESIHDETFAYCFGCQNCTTVCPVVGACEDPQKELGLLPHQIMCSLGMGLSDIAAGSGMIWSCLTCYACQEHCPQKVGVTQVLYDLKNMSASRLADPDET